MEKLEGKEDTTTEQIPETDSVGKKESGKLEKVHADDSEKLKAKKEAAREGSEGVKAMKEATREATREDAIRQDRENGIFQREPYGHPGFTTVQVPNPRAHAAPKRAAPGKPGTKVITEKTVTYENPQEAGDFYDAAGDF